MRSRPTQNVRGESMTAEKITIDQEAAQGIREALIIGLRCYVEVERIEYGHRS